MKKHFIPIAYIALCVVFIVVCALVYFSRGRGRYIGWKLRIGGLLLMLSGMMTGCMRTSINGNTCYIVDAKENKNLIGVNEEIFLASISNKPKIKSEVSPTIDDKLEARGVGIGLIAFFPLDLYHINHNIQCDFKINYMKNILIKDIYNKTYYQNIIEDPSNDESNIYTYEHELDFFTFSFDINYVYTVTSDFPISFLLGLSVQNRFRDNYKESIRLNNNDKIRTDLPFSTISPDQKYAIIYDGSLSDIYQFYLGANIGLSYKIDLGNIGYLCPYIIYNQILHSLREQQTINVSYLRFGLNWFFFQ
jgi:hypothetical protein